MTEPDATDGRGAARPAAVASRSRRSSRDRVDPADARRRRILLLATLVAVAAVAATYFVFVAGKPPGGPVRELAVFGAAVDDRDVDAVVALWSADGAGGEGARDHVAELFGQIGARGMTPGAEPPRVRKIDATTYRAIHRIGEVEVESIWAWDGQQFRLTAFDLTR